MVSAVTTSASVNMLAVACCGSSPEGPVRGMVRLYDLHSGSLVQSFGEHGIRDGQLSNVAGMRFTADGQQLVLVEAGRSRLSLFDCRGAFLRFIGDRAYMRQPHDVDFAPNGDMIVVDKDNSIFVFAGDGFSLKRRFGRLQGASGPGYNGHEFMYPTAIACHGGYVYILDSEAPRVHVFQ